MLKNFQDAVSINLQSAWTSLLLTLSDNWPHLTDINELYSTLRDSNGLILWNLCGIFSWTMLIAQISTLLITFLRTLIPLELLVTVILPLNSSVSLNLARTSNLLKKKSLYTRSSLTCIVS